MDPIEILEKYGLPIAILIPVGYFLWKQQHWIQEELIEELEERFKRLEGIIIKLIDNAKKNEIKQEGIEKSFKALVQIITKLLKEKKK